MRPLFLLSLPRSGSTLAQRVLAAHPAVSTAGEPHVLLPLVYALRRDGARAEYWHAMAAEAHQDFVASLRGGEEAWRDAVRAYAQRLYEAAAEPGSAYFVDKTPRYALIATDLLRIFPDAAFVVLWRNPLAVLDSMLDTFRAGRFEPPHFAVDLYTGLDRLVEAARDERVVHARYEELTAGPQAWEALFAALGLEWDPAVLERFAKVRLPGRLGDPGRGERDRVAAARDAGAARSRVRRAWAARYLDWLGPERAQVMGYDLDALRAGIGAPRGVGVADLWHLARARREQRGREGRLAALDGPLPTGERWR